MADVFEFAEEADASPQLRGLVARLRGSLKSRDVLVRHLKSLAGVLEGLPQDVGALGDAREGLEQVLLDAHVLGSKHKDVRVYAAVCHAHMLRIYAPDTPCEDRELEAVFDLLLWMVEQVREFKSPMFELAVSVLQTISQTKSYYLLLDLGREDAVVDWVTTLLQSINDGSSAVAGPHALEVLQGLVADESANEAVLEALLSQLVPPKSKENPAACQLAQSVLRGCEADIKPQLQRFLTALILTPIRSNSDLHAQCYSLIYKLYQVVPQVLLPVWPHLTSELMAEGGDKRLEAVQLLGRLFSLPGSRLGSECDEVLEKLLERYQDVRVDIRLAMLEFTPRLLAGITSEPLQREVLVCAAKRLQDFEEKVRLAAVGAACLSARRLLVGAPAAGAACRANQLALDGGLMDSQEDGEAAAAELGVAYSPPPAATAPGAAAAAAEPAGELQFMHEVLHAVSMRMRDTKAAVRKEAARGLLDVFRTVAAAGDAQQQQLSKLCWAPARVVLCAKADTELRVALVEDLTRDGLLGPGAAAGHAAAVWVQVWLAASPLERDAVMQLLGVRARMQGDALVFLGLRRKLCGKDKEPDAANAAALREDLDRAARQLAAQLPHPHKAAEGMAALQAVKDNHTFTALQQALAPGATAEAVAKARADALSRAGSRSHAAKLIHQLLLWARPAAWLPGPLLAALLELAAGDPDGDTPELVRGAFQLLQRLSKVAPMLFAGVLPQLHGLLRSEEPDLQQLGAQLLATCAWQQRKRGIVLAASPDAATAALVKQQLLPLLRRLARGHSTAGGDDDDQPSGSPAGAPGSAAPKAAKWAVYGLAGSQDGGAARLELQQLADELVAGLDSGASDAASRLQALSAVGRVVPDAFARHAEQLLGFVVGDYLLTYLDAAALSPAALGAAGGRSPTSQAEAAGVALKAAALKALAAGCVPDSDSADVPVETQQVAARLARDLEGLLDPDEEQRPPFLGDAPGDVAGQLRLAAASALLRLARRHDARLPAGTYCQLALVMQDTLEEVRAAFAAKVHKLVGFFQARPSTHQLAAKYAAVLPLAAVDPARPNKEAAGRLLREWVAGRRRAVAQLVTAAAAGGSASGGSTLQDLPEMALPYCLYVLAHHPDFPQGEDADDPGAYEPFQFMLQFTLQPLLAGLGGEPAGAMLPAVAKMCRVLKRTADTAEEPATQQLYTLCDMAQATLGRLAEAMGLQGEAAPHHYPGVVVLPSGLYRPLPKEEQGGLATSYLPPGFEVVLDPQPAAALVALPQQPAAAKGRGSKRRPALHKGEGQAAKRPCGAGAGDRPRKEAAGRRAKSSSDDGWGSDTSEDPPGTAANQQLTRRQQQLQKQQQEREQQQQQAGGSPAATDGGEGKQRRQSSAFKLGSGARGSAQQQKQKQPAGSKAAAGKQLPLSFNAAAAADASSPMPASRRRPRSPAGGGGGRAQQPEPSGSSGGEESSEDAAADEPPAKRGAGRQAGGAAPAARDRRAAARAAASPRPKQPPKQHRRQGKAQAKRGAPSADNSSNGTASGASSGEEDAGAQDQTTPRRGKGATAAAAKGRPSRAAAAAGGGRPTRRRAGQ